MSLRILLAGLLMAILLIAGNAVRLSAQEHTYGFHADEKAFDGNDLISYFDGKVVKGSEKITYTYKDVKLYFSSEENRERFKKEPEKYFPAYNGWCAIALAGGTLARPDYNNYKVQDGKLLFFEVRAFFNGRTAWEKDPDINRITADAKFNEIFKKDDK